MQYRLVGNRELKLRETPSVSGTTSVHRAARAVAGHWPPRVRARDRAPDLANNSGPPYGSAEATSGQILRRDLAGDRDEIGPRPFHLLLSKFWRRWRRVAQGANGNRRSQVKFTSELVAGERMRVSTKDPQVIDQLNADPDAQIVAESDDMTSFELPKAAFELRFPA